MIPNPYLLAAALALGISIGGTTGWKINGWRLTSNHNAELAEIEKIADQAQASERELIRVRANAVRLAQSLEVARNREAEIIEVEVERDVIRYITTDSASDCGVDLAGVRIINRAASSDRVRPSRTDTASPSRILLAARSPSRSGGYFGRDRIDDDPQLCEVSGLLESGTLFTGLGARSAPG